ncbi:hypothetical protein ZIOFF_038122 [Zingiber officinale]|uniref:Polycomb protein SUZ12-like zinc finger domain-containing protein n=1 Tax=Zingiber officinale TaxID=94328 RepID=A0A8J5GTA0_ZINOF|nr:hypothetical protein ZIOFF_038122 [Zingiber officinale]
MGLRYHLNSSHDLFNFEFWVTEEYQAVNVSVRTDVWSFEVRFHYPYLFLNRTEADLVATGVGAGVDPVGVGGEVAAEGQDINGVDGIKGLFVRRRRKKAEVGKRARSTLEPRRVGGLRIDMEFNSNSIKQGKSASPFDHQRKGKRSAFLVHGRRMRTKHLISVLNEKFQLVCGYPYPAYECYKTIELNKQEIGQLRFWSQYWILFGLLRELGVFADILFSWLPFYYGAKLGAFLYLWHSRTKTSVPEMKKYAISLMPTMNSIEQQTVKPISLPVKSVLQVKDAGTAASSSVKFRNAICSSTCTISATSKGSKVCVQSIKRQPQEQSTKEPTGDVASGSEPIEDSDRQGEEMPVEVVKRVTSNSLRKRAVIAEPALHSCVFLARRMQDCFTQQHIPVQIIPCQIMDL